MLTTRPQNKVTIDGPFRFVGAMVVVCMMEGTVARGQDATPIHDVDVQPLIAQVERVAQSLDNLGAPLTPEVRAKLDAAFASPKSADAIAGIQQALDPLCLVRVEINPESRVKAFVGAAAPRLVEQGWRVFLVKVQNEAGVTAPLACRSPNAAPLQEASDGDPEPKQTITTRDVRDRWLDLSLYEDQPLGERLSGLRLEYRIIELYSRDRGRREAKLALDVGQGTQELGFRNEVNLLFECEPSVDVRLEVVDDDGQPTTGQFTFRDPLGRVYPARSRRLAPDFFFHDQVYRADGESVRLPAGKYTVTYTRGPEYQVLRSEINVPQAEAHTERFQLRRWIDMASRGWFSSDHHIHAAGCAHYASPTQGVEPQDMIRHIKGEDLNVGCVLAWGPCWYHQKQFFQGAVDAHSTPKNLMRYDVEVSGFPSSNCGHLVLLRLKEDDYPGTTRIDQWPSWDLPILQWGQSQGGVVGFAHSGWGLSVPATKLPTDDVPWYDGIGANEYIVDVTHGACDFISAVDTPAVWELNIWYHTLNCGFTTRISGETDFPCIYGERVGLGRSYVKLAPRERLDFDAWADATRDGRSYCSDGLTHLFDFEVNGLGVGEQRDGRRASFLAAAKGEALTVRVKAAAMLEETPRDEIRKQPLGEQPYWHIERARVGDSPTVPVELIVNGEAVQQRIIEADGNIHEIDFDYRPLRSSWVAVRIFPAAHTNPIFVEVDHQPIRASRRSAQWCLESVDRCWASKSPLIRESEREAAQAAYDHARQVYRQIEGESFDDGTLKAQEKKPKDE
jgi:hypothetical protein